ncbi:MAG: MFS transporter [Oscillospiraceae bacterium]|nr:MFS transporter [Oscillospiraceae bacterium]
MQNKTQKGPREGVAQFVLIALVGCLIYALNNGVRVNYGLISAAIERATGFDAAAVSFAVALAQLFYGVSQPVFGALALKKTNASVLALGAGMLCAGFLLTPLCTRVWMLDLLFGLVIGGGTGAMAFGLVMSAVTPILGEKKAAAVSGVINGAGGIGGSILAPVAQSLIDRGGLRALMRGFSILSAVIAALCVWLHTAEKKAGKEPGQAEAPEEAVTGRAILNALKSRDFLHLALAFFTCGFFMAIIETQLYAQIVGLGFSGQTAAFAFTVYGIFGMIGPILAGFLCVKVRCKWVLGTLYSLRPAAVILFLLMRKTVAAVYFFVVLLGLIGNATVPPTTNLLSKLYGAKKLGLLSGTAFVFHQIGSFLSTYLGGILVSSTGSYALIWLAGGALAAAAALLSFTVREPQSEKVE